MDGERDSDACFADEAVGDAGQYRVCGVCVCVDVCVCVCVCCAE